MNWCPNQPGNAILCFDSFHLKTLKNIITNLTANDLSGSPYRGEIAGSNRLGAEAGIIRGVIPKPSPNGVRLESIV